MNGIEKYRDMTDHDIAIITAAKLDALSDKVDAFITIKQELQKAHECRMDTMDTNVEAVKKDVVDIDQRVKVLETYFKIAVGFIVLGVTVFGVYIVDLIIRH